jgi:hypothetical protein
VNRLGIVSRTPATSVSSALTKIARAQSHFDDFDRRALEFITNARPYRVQTAIERVDQGRSVATVILSEDVIQPPAHEWAPIIGDMAHNLRSALDHVACQLSIANGGDVECEQTSFPIFVDDAPGSRKQFARCAGMFSHLDRTIARRLQPYQTADPRTHPLWLLHTLNNIDKHRRLHVVSTAVYGHAIDVLTQEGFRIGRVSEKNATQKNEILLIIQLEHTTAEQPRGLMRMSIAAGVGFGPESGPLAGLSARTALHGILAHVRYVLIQFERTLGPLPLYF